MNRLNFKDSRGDEYIYIRYNTGEVKVTKKSRLSDGSHIIDFRADAVEKLHEFLHLKQKDLMEES
jgi:hypothetical protein